MKSSRLEAFSDGVLAIIITIMVLEMGAPEETTWHALKEVVPTFVSYVVSFIYVGIYWNNHHHLFQATERVNGRVLWANLFLLFWLSLIPFTTSWVGEHHLQALPVATYGFVLFMAAIAYNILQITLLRNDRSNNRLAKVTKVGLKEFASVVLYALSIGLSYVNVWIAVVIIAGIAALWVVPDRRIED